MDSLPTKVWERRLRGAGASPSTPSLEERRRKLAFFIDADDDDYVDDDVDLLTDDDHGACFDCDGVGGGAEVDFVGPGDVPWQSIEQ